MDIQLPLGNFSEFCVLKYIEALLIYLCRSRLNFSLFVCTYVILNLHDKNLNLYTLLNPSGLYSVNSENFMRVIFLQNCPDVKFRENKSSPNCEITLSFTNGGKSCPSRECLTWQIYLLTLFAE